ncbi:hypothetical protein K2Z84_30885 [Candidatus Binatia bacterium]|nr:hypothetical protein [Candidatus Binatia bacterium]
MQKHFFRSGALALAASLTLASGALADSVTSREVTETKTISGTVSDVTPSSRIVVTSTTGAPTTYTLDQRTVFVDEAGNVVSYDQVRGQPVKIYVSENKEQPVVVERVVVSKPATRVIETQPAPQVMKRTETRTETTTHEAD